MSDELKPLSGDDREFLAELQHELATQDKVCQASPRYWGIMHEFWYPCREGDQDRYDVYDEDGCDVFSLEEAIKDEFESLLDESTDLVCISYEMDCSGIDIDIKPDGSWALGISNESDALSWLSERNPSMKSVPMACEHAIAENAMFLTLRECKEHIERNSHHYHNPRPYAMTALRSPQVDRLLSILERTDWLACCGEVGA